MVDNDEHVTDMGGTCWCDPKVEEENGIKIFVHRTARQIAGSGILTWKAW